MKIKYVNMPIGYGRFNFALRYYFNTLRTWYLFHIKYPGVKYNGFIRVMPQTRFLKKASISLGSHVQFGRGCFISSDLHIENYVLIAGKVSFVGKMDHLISTPCTTIWDSPRGKDTPTIIKSDVWIGHNSTIIAGVIINEGAVVAAGSLVTKDIPACELWGGVPAKKIKDRFIDEEQKNKHLDFLKILK